MEASKRKNHRGLIAAVVLGMALLIAAANAAAADAPTRDEYVAQLESVCRPNADATQKAMKGARADIKAEQLKVASGKFAKATAIFVDSLAAIEAAAPPAGDEAKLAKWIGYLQMQLSYLKQITTQLRADHAVPAQRLIARFIHNGNLANNTVLAFGFDYCSFKFSRFG
jgi:hypothetical protein